METGRKILNLRKDLGVQQNALAELTSVTPSALSRIESGRHQPKGPVALRLARSLGVTVDYLLDDEAPYPPPEHELLSHVRNQKEERRSERLQVTTSERKVVLALRDLDRERRELVEEVLLAPRHKVVELLEKQPR